MRNQRLGSSDPMESKSPSEPEVFRKKSKFLWKVPNRPSSLGPILTSCSRYCSQSFDQFHVIDDQKEMLALMKRIISEETGYEVIIEDDPVKALDHFNTRSFFAQNRINFKRRQA